MISGNKSLIWFNLFESICRKEKLELTLILNAQDEAKDCTLAVFRVG